MSQTVGYIRDINTLKIIGTIGSRQPSIYGTRGDNLTEIPDLDSKIHLQGCASLAGLNPHACPGAQSLSGTNLDGCQAIHAEQNALLQCGKVWEIDTCYVTASPCMTCVKLLLNTSCQRIVFSEQYPHAEAMRLWLGAGREWIEGGLG